MRVIKDNQPTIVSGETDGWLGTNTLLTLPRVRDKKDNPLDNGDRDVAKGQTRVSSLTDLVRGVLANLSIGPDRV